MTIGRKDRSIEELKGLYDQMNPKTGEPCVYCGLLATDKEHVIPRIWIDGMKDMLAMGFDVKVPKEIIVPSCRECNNIAGGQVFKSFREKREYIREYLRKKYKKFYKAEVWSDEDIDALSGRLREHVYIFNQVVKVIKKRLDIIKKK